MGKNGEISEILTKVEKEISKQRKRDRKKKETFRDLLHDLKKRNSVEFSNRLVKFLHL